MNLNIKVFKVDPMTLTELKGPDPKSISHMQFLGTRVSNFYLLRSKVMRFQRIAHSMILMLKFRSVTKFKNLADCQEITASIPPW